MVEKWCLELMNKFPFVKIDTYVVMPNHFHGIITVGAALCGRPEQEKGRPEQEKGRLEKDEGCTNKEEGQSRNNKWQPDKNGQPHRVAPTLGNIVNWFKTMTTNEYLRQVKQNNWYPFQGKLWQRNYYEHIIRNEKEFNKICRYIEGNSVLWDYDIENPKHFPVAGV